MKKSLQRIEDHYLELGYSGEKLRNILKKDSEYQRILKEKKKKLTKKFEVSKIDQRKYVLATDDDYIILGNCKTLEKLKLSEKDKELVKLIKSQLEDEWRKSLIKKLDKVLRKYENY